MKVESENIEILNPKNQLHLYGYKNYFNSFVKLFQKKQLPNTILLTGTKGSGKSTFSYHFINYLLSLNEANKYSISNFVIDPENASYKNLCNGIHPNFFLLDNGKDENIKIENVRNMLRNLNKSTYSSNLKIVLIDNIEYLNVNSSNALLKILEEPNNNTFFFIIHNSAYKIPNTIKSRCIEFKFFLKIDEKKNILSQINNQYENMFDLENINEKFYLDSPGNILNYLKIMKDDNFDLNSDKLPIINFLIEKYKKKKDSKILYYISFLVELLYNDLACKNYNKLNIYFYNKFKILKQISDIKKYNLDKNNFFISLKGILQNES